MRNSWKRVTRRRMSGRSWNISVRTGRNASWCWRNAPAANTKPSGTRSSPTCRLPFRAIYDMDYRLFLTKTIGIHADLGTQILIGLYPPKFPPESDGLLQIRFIFEQFHLFCHFDCKIHIAVCSRSGDPVGSHHIFFTGERRFDPL